MKAQTKSALILGATLVVGILIGSFATGAVFNNRIQKLQTLGRLGGFAGTLEAVIQPRDDAQREQVRAVLERTGSRLGMLRQDHFTQILTAVDTLRADLKPLLSSEQQERVDQWFERDRSSERRRSRRPGASPRRRPELPPH